MLGLLGSWFGGNLDGSIGKRWFMIAMIVINIMLVCFSGLDQIKKSILRGKLTNMTAQLSKEQSQHVAEVERITVKNNQSILDMLAKEEIARLNAELENERAKAIVEIKSNKELNKKLKELEQLEINECELSEEVKTLLNGKTLAEELREKL